LSCFYFLFVAAYFLFFLRASHFGGLGKVSSQREHFVVSLRRNAHNVFTHNEDNNDGDGIVMCSQVRHLFDEKLALFECFVFRCSKKACGLFAMMCVVLFLRVCFSTPSQVVVSRCNVRFDLTCFLFEFFFVFLAVP